MAYLEELLPEFRFSSKQIKHYMRENKFTKLECLFYLWAFNNFGTFLFVFITAVTFLAAYVIYIIGAALWMMNSII